MRFRGSTPYSRFSKAVYGYYESYNVLLEKPDLVKDVPRFAYLSALYEYMTPVFPYPSMHQIVVGQWEPNELDLSTGNDRSFGTTINLRYPEFYEISGYSIDDA